MLRTLGGHRDWVTALPLSPDGKLLGLLQVTRWSGYGIWRRERRCRRSRGTETGFTPLVSLWTASCWRLHHMTRWSGYRTWQREQHYRHFRVTAAWLRPSHSPQTPSG